MIRLRNIFLPWLTLRRINRLVNSVELFPTLEDEDIFGHGWSSGYDRAIADVVACIDDAPKPSFGNQPAGAQG